jgi:hypothetical protein
VALGDFVGVAGGTSMGSSSKSTAQYFAARNGANMR